MWLVGASYAVKRSSSRFGEASLLLPCNPSSSGDPLPFPFTLTPYPHYAANPYSCHGHYCYRWFCDHPLCCHQLFLPFEALRYRSKPSATAISTTHYITTVKVRPICLPCPPPSSAPLDLAPPHFLSTFSPNRWVFVAWVSLYWTPVNCVQILFIPLPCIDVFVHLLHGMWLHQIAN